MMRKVKSMLVPIKIVETYTKYKEVEIPDTGNLEEAYEYVDKIIDSGKITLPHEDKESKYNMDVSIV